MSDSDDPATGESLLEALLEIETPERVKIVYELAGIGSRFAAGTIDACLLVTAWCGAGVIIAAFAGPWLKTVIQDPLMIGLVAAAIFLVILWLYCLGFETFWSGQTPGKRVLRLRVVSEEGGPAPISAIFVRNLLRVVDALPVIFAHVLGGVVMFISPRAKRIGDYAAGTVVVRERPVDLSLEGLGSTSDSARSIGQDDLLENERLLVRRFSDRKHELTADSRVLVARRIAEAISERLDLPDMAPELLLTLLHQGRKPSELRDQAGPSLDDDPEEAP